MCHHGLFQVSELPNVGVMRRHEVSWGGPFGWGSPGTSHPLPSPVDPRSGDWGPPGDRSGWRKLKTGELPRDACQPWDHLPQLPWGGDQSMPQPCPMTSQEEEPVMAMDTHPAGEPYLPPLLF